MNLASLRASSDLRSMRALKLRDTLYRLLASGIRAGSAAPATVESLALTAEDDGRTARANNYQKVASDLRNSSDLAEGLRLVANRGDKILLGISSRVADVASLLVNVADLALYQRKITMVALKPQIYPGFIAVVIAGATLYTSTSLVPKLLTMIPPAKQPWISTTAMSVGAVIMENAMILSIAILSLIALIIWALPNWVGRGRDFADKLPLFSSYKSIQTGGFLTAFTFLMRNNIDVNEALDALEEHATPYLRSYIYRMRARYAKDAEGKEQNPAEFMNIGIMDADTALEVRILAGQKSLAYALEKVVVEQKDALLQRVAISATAGAGVIYLIIAALMATMLLSTLGLVPIMFEVTQSASRR